MILGKYWLGANGCLPDSETNTLVWKRPENPSLPPLISLNVIDSHSSLDVPTTPLPLPDMRSLNHVAGRT